MNTLFYSRKGGQGKTTHAVAYARHTGAHFLTFDYDNGTRDLVEITSSSSFNLADIRTEKTIIYFIIPAQHTEYYGFWTSIFFRSVFNACMREMPSKKTLPAYILYDEFGHSTIPSFVSLAWVYSYFFLFGLCVRAEPAAVFAALLDLGFLRTFEAALAAFLLVTSLLLFFGMGFFLSLDRLLILTIWGYTILI